MDIFLEKYDLIFKEFAKGKPMVLSSAENNKVTSRMMSIVVVDRAFYFQTDKTFKKYQQLINNPQVALCSGNISIEGICEEIGHPLDHVSFCEIYKECFCSSFNKYSSLKNERLFVVKPMYVKRWVYIEGAPFMEVLDIKNRRYHLTKYEGV